MSMKHEENDRAVTLDKACFLLFEGPGRREAARGHVTTPCGHVKELFALSGNTCSVPSLAMWRGTKEKGTHDANSYKERRSDWRFTVEHIGRELRKLYPPVDVPPGLHALFTEERRRARTMHRDRQQQGNESKRSK
jgi:hypothetical protein